MNWVAVGIVVPWVIVAFGCWLGYYLVRQNGRLLLRLDALEERFRPLFQALEAQQGPSEPSGLPAGSVAPAFELPDLAGRSHSLAEFLGRPILLIFFDPGCGLCAQMAPDLAALPGDGGPGRPLPLVITTGGLEANRQFVAEHDLRCPVLLQKQREVAADYRANGTPTGYLIDAEGNISGELTIGAEALLALAHGAAEAPSANGKHPQTHRGNRSLSDSRLNRSGLDAGTTAPLFRLPALSGGEVALEECRGCRLTWFAAPFLSR